MEPKYSILLCNQSYSTYEKKIEKWLSEGIKVIWFSKNEDEVEKINNKYEEYAKAFLLMTYKVDIDDIQCIVDGDDKSCFVETILTSACELFNSAQYMVEHCKSTEHIIVQASAGTGKTTVMIDRIMFLMHTVEDLHMADIHMITFTNDAANQMNKRLQDNLMTRYRLTRNKKYLLWVEEQSQMNISTIHSFAYQMLKEFGIGESFTKNLTIRSFQYEKKELIKDFIDDRIDENNTVLKQLGVPFYKANNIVSNFWSGFSKIGVSHNDMKEMDWGKPINEDSVAFQNIITNAVEVLDDKYFDIKREYEAVALDDIMRDLQKVLQSDKLPQTDISMKYLFIDEFQDSDLSQIDVACILVNLLSATLFVVGDVKQSIYRFRGATDKSFYMLKKDFREMNINAFKEFILVNNYRTATNVINGMDKYFKHWGEIGYLQYDKPVIPFKKEMGKIKMLHGESVKEEMEAQIAEVISIELDNLIERVKGGKQKITEKTRVVCLTRSNAALNSLAAILRKNKIPAMVKRDGSFYASEAVRDFYMMVASFLFCDEPKYIFNYLLTPYAGEIDSLDINAMEWLHGDYDNLVSYLDRFLDQTTWKMYHKQLRLKPVLSVFKDMLDNISVIDNFIMNYKARKQSEGWTEERSIAATLTEARQYYANLEKLVEILQQNFGGEKVSLYDVYNFLKLNIATNRSEGEANVELTDDYTSVLCMTVHKSKGLEFDTVIIPFTTSVFPTKESTEIIIDSIKKRVGWNYVGDGDVKANRWRYPPMKNNLYKEMKAEDRKATIMEETRILYVAMTRAINNLICIVPDPPNANTWAKLIEEVGVDYE